MSRKKLYIFLGACLFFLFVYGVFFFFLFSPRQTEKTPGLNNSKTNAGLPSGKNLHPGSLKVTGYTPRKKQIENFGQKFEVSFSLPPGNIIVETKPQTPILVKAYPLKIGGYITVIPKDGWRDGTTYIVTVKRGSASTTGEILESDYLFTFTLKQYLGL